MRRKTFRLKDAAHNDKDGGHDDDIEDGNDHQNPWPPRHDELCVLAGFPNTNAIADQQGQRQSFWNLLNTKFGKNDIVVHANPILKSITNALNKKSDIQLW